MDQEIDNLFLSDTSTNYTEKSINDLEDSIKNFQTILPYINLIEEKILSIDSNFELYHVKLDRLANEMKDIESQNTKLENEILYQTSIYERLKDLLIKLEIKEEHFIVLETDSLESVEGVTRIEQAVEILNAFNVTDYTIRVVKEKQKRVNDALINFYDRFVRFMNGYLIDERVSGEFKVHNELYRNLEKYKNLYKLSSRFDFIYKKLCSAYVKYAKIRYENELSNYLKKLYDLNTESKNIENLDKTITTVLETYRSLLKVELKFLQKMSISNDLSEIFVNSSHSIIHFLKDLYYIHEIETISYINNNIKEIDEEESVYYKFQEQMVLLVGKLKKNFLQKEAELRDKDQGLDRFKKYRKFSRMDDFNILLFRINLSRINRYDGNKNVFAIINTKRLLENLKLIYNCSLREYDEIVNKTNQDFEKYVIDYIFENGNVMTQIINLKKNLVGSSNFQKNIKFEIFDIIKDNLDDSEIEKIKSKLIE
ncbi:hypothetical protein P3W45_001018 [Vairimorpha bombi]